MHEYEIYVPLCDNDGKSADPRRLKRLRALLVKQFGGLTHFPQTNVGFWKIGRLTFRDKIVILRVLSESPTARNFLKRLKKTLVKEWNQADVLIVARTVSTL